MVDADEFQRKRACPEILVEIIEMVDEFQQVTVYVHSKIGPA